METKVRMVLSEPVFLTAIGLISSGYDLYNESDAELSSIVALIRREFRDPDMITYFKNSRSSSCEVNPYWPRGSALYAASLFVSEDYSTLNLDSYLAFEEKSNSSSLWQDDSFVEWISEFPNYLKMIKAHPMTNHVISLIHSFIENKRNNFELLLDKCKNKILNFSDSTSRKIIYLPNPLQAEQCTDYVMIDKTLHVISTEPHFSAILHEYLHLCLEEHRQLLLKLYKKYSGEPLFDANRLSMFGYSWDDSIESNLRCLEEGIVRALTEMISRETVDEKTAALRQVEKDGFLVAGRFVGGSYVKLHENDLVELLNQVFLE